MFKLAALSLIAGAAAFAPAQQGASSTALKAFESEVSVYARCIIFAIVAWILFPRLCAQVEPNPTFNFNNCSHE